MSPILLFDRFNYLRARISPEFLIYLIKIAIVFCLRFRDASDKLYTYEDYIKRFEYLKRIDIALLINNAGLGMNGATIH